MERDNVACQHSTTGHIAARHGFLDLASYLACFPNVTQPEEPEKYCFVSTAGYHHAHRHSFQASLMSPNKMQVDEAAWDIYCVSCETRVPLEFLLLGVSLPN